jgi:hypothetical protein
LKKFQVQSNEIANTTAGMPHIEGANLNDAFYLKEFHFHWDAITNEKGSEHHINFHAFPLEVCILRYIEFCSKKSIDSLKI